MTSKKGFYSCEICQNVYGYRHHLTRHLDTAHQIDRRTHWILILWKKLAWRLA